VTTVSTLAQFTAAVDEKDTSARIVVVKGVISGNTKVRIGSNKSVIGLAGAGMSLQRTFNTSLCLFCL
jgi:pectate lyase